MIINSYFGYSFVKNVQIKVMNSKSKNLKKDVIANNNKENFDKIWTKLIINLKNKLTKLINAFNEKK